MNPMQQFIHDQAGGIACATSWAASLFIMASAVILSSGRWGWNVPGRVTVPIGVLALVYGWRGWTLVTAAHPSPEAILSTATLAIVAMLVLIELIIVSWRRAVRHQVEAEAAHHVARALGPLPPHLPGKPHENRPNLH